jgi:hypothetical protein
MSETWVTYFEAATAIGTSSEAIRQKSIREQWRRRRRQDGKTQVLIDLKTQKPRAPRDRPSERANVRVDNQGKIAALEGQIVGSLGDGHPYNDAEACWWHVAEIKNVVECLLWQELRTSTSLLRLTSLVDGVPRH